METLRSFQRISPTRPVSDQVLPPTRDICHRAVSGKSGQTGTLCLGRSGCGGAGRAGIALPSLEICLLIFQNPVQSLLVYGGFPSSPGQHYVLTSCSPGDLSQYSNHSARCGVLRYSVTSPPEFYRYLSWYLPLRSINNWWSGDHPELPCSPPCL